MAIKFDAAVTAYLEQVKSSSADYFVGMDVGATNARVALTLRGSGDLVQLHKFEATDAKTLVQGVDKVGAAVLEVVKRSPKGAVAAVAGPVVMAGMEVEITNYSNYKVFRVTDFATEFFPHSTSFFINDLEGTCFGIEALGNERKLSQFFELAWEPKVPKVVAASIKETLLHPGKNMVLAAGTGLGTALLTPESLTSSEHTVLPLEGGHTSVIASTRDSAEGKEERDLLAHLSKTLYNGEYPIEYEDLVSGRGVLNAYNFFAPRLGLPTTTSISTVLDGLKGSGPAYEASMSAFKAFFRFLVRCAQGLTVATQSKCVFLAGDNQVANLEILRKLSDLLKAEWESHTKPQWVQPVFVWTQTKEFNLNLKGALFVASRVK